MARPLGKDALYARELGVIGKRHGSQVIKRGGGAEKLRALDESARNLLLKPNGPRVPKTGLAARGMVGQEPIPRCFRPRITEWDLDRMYVAHKILRGLA